jgi:hypothetical protein
MWPRERIDIRTSREMEAIAEIEGAGPTENAFE